MANEFFSLTKEYKGYLLIVAGVILLLHTFNFLRQWLNLFLVVAAVGMIVIGALQSGLHVKIREMIAKKPSGGGGGE